MSTQLPTSEHAIAYAESLRTANDCYADRCSIRLLDDLTALRAQNKQLLSELQHGTATGEPCAEVVSLRARLAEVEHERDVALVNEREMATALRKQQDNYNHLTNKIDNWKDCIEAATNRERAALAERDGADAACLKWKDSYEVAAREVERLIKDRDDWKAKHWKAHDDFHRQFLEMENLRQQVTSSTNALRNCALAASAGNIEQIAWIVESALSAKEGGR